MLDAEHPKFPGGRVYVSSIYGAKPEDAQLMRASPRLVEALRRMIEAYELEASADNPALLEARAAYEDAVGEKLEPPF